MEQHQKAVAAISATVQRFHAHHSPFRIFHGSTNSTRPLSLPRAGLVDTSALHHILHIDAAARTALVEPAVPMDALVRATLARGLVPPVVPEFPGITVGGAFAGTCGESSSFRRGFFDRGVARVELVRADGAVVVGGASEAVNADLFAGAAGSLGTLGVVTLLEVRLVEAREWVEVGYEAVGSVREAVERLARAMGDAAVDFVDGIMFSRTSGTVVTGRFVSAPSPSLPLSPPSSPASKIQTFHRPQDPWFYLHAQDVSALSKNSHSAPVREIVPVESYLFRYDRGAFWTGIHAFHYFLVPFTALFRYLLDYFMHTRVMYHALHESGHMDRYILQDCVLPSGNAEAFVTWVDENLGIWPLWLCPVGNVPEGKRSFHPRPSKAVEGDWALNIGVWGPGPSDSEAFGRVNRALERKLWELGGMKWLYAQVFCGEEEFWAQYDREGYQALREKWHATSLPSVWEKVRRKERRKERKGLKGWLWRVWPISGLYGVLRAWTGGDYLIERERGRRSAWFIFLILGLIVGALALLLANYK